MENAVSKEFQPEFVFRLDAEALGRLFMPSASTFEVLQTSPLQEDFVVDSIVVESTNRRCRLTYSEWEEEREERGQKVWVSEYAIELKLDDLVAYGTYSTSFVPDQRGAATELDHLRQKAENDFILCAKLLGRSVRRDLVVDEDQTPTSTSRPRLH